MWHSIDEKEVLAAFKTTEEGLPSEEAAKRLEEYGKNEIKQLVRVSKLEIFLQQFKSVFVIILLFAGAFSLFIRHYIDFGVIAAIIVINSTIGFVQQYKAEKTISEMKQMLVPKVRVMRNGIVQEILSTELVPGDIVIVSEGDHITADCRIIQANGLQTNEAALTGESFPQDKSSEIVSVQTALADRENMLYAGTSVARGNAKAVVVATNMKTEFGKIAYLVQAIKAEKTPLEKKLDSFSKKVAIAVIALALITIVAGIWRGEEIFDMILAGTALAVSVIPEGLPAIIAITLALAIARMKSNNALIRKLPAAETLGRVTVICTDKTGTLTEENISVTNLFCGNQFTTLKDNKFYQKGIEINPKKNSEIYILLKTGVLCNNARAEIVNGSINAIGDPTEKALIISAMQSGIVKKDETEREIRIREYSFSSSRKMMSIVRKRNGQLISYVKGAPDIVLQRCTKELRNGRLVYLNYKRKAELTKVYETMASEALRVLAFAFKPLESKFSQENAESSLVFAGFQGMLDAPRKEVAPAISDCNTAGISVKMITGDSLLTAVKIAQMIKLNGKALEEKEIAKLSEQEFNDCVRNTAIFARVTPETKLRIIKSLKYQGEIVAVTGDGVNDILALKEAHIGVAMGIRGTDVARDVSDIILLDDNFSTIVQAVREGRKVYDNMKKAIKAHLAANFAQIFIVMFALFLSLPLPLLPLAILWMNLITDSLPSLALTVEKEESDIMKRRPHYKESILDDMKLFLIISGIFAFAITVGLFVTNYQADLAKARTIALTTTVFCEMFIVLSCRSRDKSMTEIGFFTNKYLLGAILIAVVLQLIAIYTPLAVIFGFVPLSLTEILMITALSAPIFIFFELVKTFKINI